MDPAVQALRTSGGSLNMAAAAVLTLGYFYIFWDKRKDSSDSKDDGQVGLKVVLYTLLLVSLGVAAGGLEGILGWLLSGAKGGAGFIKEPLAHLAAGGVGAVVVLLVLLPRTNAKDKQQVERFTAGAVAVVAGISAVMSFDGMLTGVLGSGGDGWRSSGAQNAGSFLVAGALAFFSVTRFGTMSGWTAPAKPAPMMQQGAYQPQGGYMQQQQMQQHGGYQGYPQGGQMQGGGGYPPQGGGGQMPPGGGYPQGGGGPYQPR